MSIAVSLPPAGPTPPVSALRRFTVNEYHQMIQAGILTEDEPVELLEGWVALKMPRNPQHDATVHVANQAVTRALPLGWETRLQSAITTLDSEPEPDLTVVRGTARDYMSHHPGPSEVGLLIEVADSSLENDRTEKGRIYARAAIPVYWIINLRARQIEVYTDPTEPVRQPGYGSRRDFGAADVVPLELAGQQVGYIPASELLPQINDLVR